MNRHFMSKVTLSVPTYWQGETSGNSVGADRIFWTYKEEKKSIEFSQVAVSKGLITA